MIVSDGSGDRSTDVEAAIAEADLRVLAMCLYHVTGDGRWLREPFRPVRDVRLIADPDAGFDASTRDEIRRAVVDWCSRPDAGVAVTDPGRAAFGEMLSIFLGEQVPPEYVPLVREDFGFEPRDTGVIDTAGIGHLTDRSAAGAAVLIVGAGVSGLCLAIKLDRLGIPFHIVDKNPDLGGTWFENRYPGCGVDTPNHLYSFSFAPNSGWTHFFSRRDELHGYLASVADTYGITDRIEFSTAVTAGRWDEEQCRWTVTLESEGGRRDETASIVVTATGHFNRPLTARFPGQESFAGDVFHSSRWPADADLSGRRVAVVGTGASAMQIVPTIAPHVAHLTIFQRTPQWARPVAEYRRSVDPAASWLFEHIPFYDRWYRFAQFWRYGDGLLRFLRRDPDWHEPERSLNRVNERHRTEMVGYIESKLAGRPDLIEQCTPTYPPFAKRILIDNGWFDTLCEPRVELVTDPIDHIAEGGIVTRGGAGHEVDTIVMATGFDVTSLASHIDLVGRDGRTLADEWADDDPTAHLGMTVPGFPNLFVMYGPNTNMGHGGSGIWLAETQARYITDRLADMAAAGVAAIECKPDVERAYTAMIDELHDDLVWTHPGVHTYYRNANGQVRSPMPFRLVDYWAMTRASGLEDFVLTPAGAPIT